MAKYKSKFTGQQIDDGIEYGVRVTQQTFSSAQKQQARENINAQENVTDMAKLGCGIGTCSTSSGTALVVSLTNYELVQNGFVAVTFEHDVPAGATLNVNGKGAKPIIYKGSAIEADVIKADDTVMFAYDGTNYVVTSLGGSTTYPEFVTISLTQSGGSDSDLIGATVVVTNDNTSETIFSTTWQGSDITVRVNNGVDYTVTFGNVTGYKTPQSVSYRASEGYTRNINVVYTDLSNAVDLGLPSGTLWCSHNVGAVNVEDSGMFFSWANTEGKAPDSGYVFNQTNYNTTTGSSLTQDFSSGGSYDGVRANMGGEWRIPIRSEWVELNDNCNIELVTYNGKNCVKLTSKINGNVLYLPRVGTKNNSSEAGNTHQCFFWFNEYNTSTNGVIVGWNMEDFTFAIGGVYQYMGLPLRGVC